MLFEGKAAYERDDFAGAVGHMDTFLASYQKSREAGAAYYYRGRARQALGEIPAARDDLTKAAAATDDKGLRARAMIALADIAYAGNDMPSAEKYFRQALEDIDRRVAPADHAMFYLGCTLQRMGEWIQADRQFNALVELFDGGELAGMATLRVHAKAWTIQAGAFTRRGLADDETLRLRKAGLDVRTWDVLRPSGPMLVVQVGRFRNYIQAVKALKSTTSLSPDSFVNVTR